MEQHLRSRIRAKYGGTIDRVGNLSIAAALPDGGAATTLFSAHLDTVHRTDGYTGFRQKGNIYAALKECLGADDGAGIYVLLKLLDNDVPGTYVFTVGEEQGLIGAYRYQIPQHIKRCIAFDRRGDNEVIYAQLGEATASVVAAKWVCGALGMAHKPSPDGCFTDNCAWASDVPECINISAGYHNAHSALEWLDVKYLRALADAAVEVQWELMPTVRTPYVYTHVSSAVPWDAYGQHKTTSVFTSDTADILAAVKRNPQAAAELLQKYVDPEELFFTFLSLSGGDDR